METPKVDNEGGPREGHYAFDTRPEYRLRRPTESREGLRPLIITLHGMGHSGKKVLEQLGDNLPGSAYVLAPDGPLPYEDKDAESGRRIGHAWYVYSGDQSDFLNWAERTEQALFDLIEGLTDAHPIDPSRIHIVGYSQGGYLGGIMALRNPDAFQSVVVVNARLKNEIESPPLSASDLPQILVLHGEKDRFIPIDVARRSADALRDRGLAVTFEPFVSGHRFTEEQAQRVGAWLASRCA